MNQTTTMAEALKDAGIAPTLPLVVTAPVDAQDDANDVAPVVALAQAILNGDAAQSRAMLAIIGGLDATSNAAAYADRCANDLKAEFVAAQRRDAPQRASELKFILTLCAQDTLFRSLLVETLSAEGLAISTVCKLARKWAKRAADALAAAMQGIDADETAGAVMPEDGSEDDAEETAAESMTRTIDAAIKAADDCGRNDIAEALKLVRAMV